MFHDSEIAQEVALGRTKVSYILTDGMRPYFRRQFVSELQKSGKFCLHFDETTQSQVKKQMDLRIRYWSSKKDEVCCRFYRSLFFGHAEASVVTDAILGAFQEDGLPVENLVALGMDGPNVNKKIESLISAHLRSEFRHSGLVDIGTCNIHLIHNGFGKGLDSYGAEIEQLCIDLHHMFKYSAARRSDFEKIQLDFDLEVTFFQKHTQIRWLSLGPAIERLLKLWETIILYVKELSKFERTTPKSANFRRIQVALVRDTDITKLQALFLAGVFPLFNEFLTAFQSESPMIHLLHEKVLDIIKKLLNRFMKSDDIPYDLEDVDGTFVKNRNHQLTDEQIVLNDQVRTQLLKLKITHQKEQLTLIRKFYENTTIYLLNRLPVKNKLLKSIGCLNLDNEMTTSDSLESFQEVARKLCPEIDIAVITDEWKTLRKEEKPENSSKRIDHRWRSLLQNGKHPNTEKVIKIALIMPHGNSDVERSLSVNNNIVTKERNQLSEESIDAIRVVKDAIEFFDDKNRPECIPLEDKDFLMSVKSAHSVYALRLEEKKRKEKLEKERKEMEERDKEELKRKKEEEETKRKKLQMKEEELLEKESKVTLRVSAANDLIRDARKMFETALSQKKIDRQEVSKAQLLLHSASEQSAEAVKDLAEVRKKQKKLESKKSSLIKPKIHDGIAPLKRTSANMEVNETLSKRKA